MSFLAAVGGAATAAAGASGNTVLNYSLNRSATKYSTEKQKELAQYESFLNRQDYQWQKKLDYAYDYNQYYDLARRYAQNSSSWSVEGLRNAGLNPILAATDGNFSSTYGTGSSSGSMGHASTSSPSGFSGASGDLGVAEGARSFAAADASLSAADMARVDTETRRQMRDPTVASAKADVANKTMQNSVLAAEREKILADADTARANTAKVLTDTLDVRQGKSGSLSNLPMRIVNGLFDWRDTDQRLTDLKKEAGIRSDGSSLIPSSAKSSSRDLPYNGSIDELRKELEREVENERKRTRSHSYIHTR